VGGNATSEVRTGENEKYLKAGYKKRLAVCIFRKSGRVL